MRIKYILLSFLALGLSFSGYYGINCLENSSHSNQTNFHIENQKLFKKLGVAYLKNVEIAAPDLNQLNAKNTVRYLSKPLHYDNLEKKYGPQIARGEISPMTVRFINDKIGYGVFSEIDLKPGDFVGEYTGKIINTKDLKDGKYTWGYLNAHEMHGKEINLSLDAGPAGNELRFINHDYVPNAGMQYVLQGGIWHVCYITSRPIKKGEQILTDYGKRYWSGTRGEPYQFVKVDGTQN